MKVCLNNNFAYKYKVSDKNSYRETYSNTINDNFATTSHNQITNYPIYYNKINFKNLQKLPVDLYFIRMNMYPQNRVWASKMNCATLDISSMMRKRVPFEKILAKAEQYIHTINDNGTLRNAYAVKKVFFDRGITMFNNPKTRGYEYYQKYREYITPRCTNNIFTPKSNAKYNTAITCNILNSKCFIEVLYGTNNAHNIQTNLDLVKSAYEELKSKEHPPKEEIIKTAATIQWLIAQECPYKKGSDSIANLLTRSLMHSYGIELSPLKKGVSCDFEAFYRDLDDYIKNYPSFFENNLGY